LVTISRSAVEDGELRQVEAFPSHELVVAPAVVGGDLKGRLAVEVESDAGKPEVAYGSGVVLRPGAEVARHHLNDTHSHVLTPFRNVAQYQQ
jgi:hypothetical protein